MPSKKGTRTKKNRNSALTNVKRALKNQHKSERASKYIAVYGQAGGGNIRSNMGLF